jgi:hypothetical protein
VGTSPLWVTASLAMSWSSASEDGMFYLKSKKRIGGEPGFVQLCQLWLTELQERVAKGGVLPMLGEAEEGVFDHFGKGGVDPVLVVGHLVDGLARAHALDELLDQRGRLWAHDMCT